MPIKRDDATTDTYDESNSVTGCSSSYPIGRLTRIVESGVTTVYCYDAWGRVIQKQKLTTTTGYSYTAAGRLSGIVYADGSLVSYVRDGDGRIQSISATPPNGTATTVVSGVTYQPFGPVSGYTLGNGQSITRSYDANYRLTDLTSPAFSLHVARDTMGDITGIGNAAGANPATETYSYDPLYRLTAVTEADGSVLESVTYNPTGDRLSKTGSGLYTGAYGYNPNTHQLVSVGNSALTVDANGNTTAISAAGSVYGFGYNNRNRLTVAQLGGSTLANYTYDALGRRIQKIANGQTESYVYDEAGQLLAESGATNRDYIWMDGIPVANIDTSSGSSTMTYVTADQLGTPRVIANANGNTLWQLPYQGNPWAEQSPVSNGYTYNLRFAGQYYDQETGISYNINRDYDPSTGRAPQSDPIGPAGGWSTYAYALNNPLNYTDPLGLHFIIASGGTLTLYNDDLSVAGTYTYSSGMHGNTDYTSSGLGPTPPGVYMINPAELSPAGLFRKYLDPRDWGDYRVPLHPGANTETYGRAGFFLHGGWLRHGSEGCLKVEGPSQDQLFDQIKHDTAPIPVWVHY